MDELAMAFATFVGCCLLLLPVLSMINGLVVRSRTSSLQVRLGALEDELAALRGEVEALRRRAVVPMDGDAEATVVGKVPASLRSAAREPRRVASLTPVDLSAGADEEPTRVGAAVPVETVAAPNVDPAPVDTSDRGLGAERAASNGTSAVPSAERHGGVAASDPGVPADAEVRGDDVARGDVAAPPPATAWRGIEAQLVGNWTGILGALAVVLGTGFFGIFAALMMSAFLRFLLVLGFAGALFAASAVLARAEAWGPLSRWVRSAGAAVVLVACLGGALFTPMQWVTSDAGGLVLVGGGVVVNLATGLLAGGEVFAALHVVLGLAALAMLPAGAATLVAAAVVAAVGELAVWRQPRWGAQLAVAAVCFALWHVAWIVRLPADAGDAVRHGLAIASVLVVGGGAYVTSYRRVLAAPDYRPASLALHLVVQGSVALGLALHDLGGSLATVGMLAASIGLHRASAVARGAGATWLFRTDRLVALGLATAAMVTLHRQDLDPVVLALLVAAPWLVWSANEARRDDDLLIAVPMVGVQLMAPVAVAVALAEPAPATLHLAALLVAVAAVLAASAFGERAQAGRASPVSLWLGVPAGLLLVGADHLALDQLAPWGVAMPAVAVAALVAGRQPWPTLGLEVGLSAVLVHALLFGGLLLADGPLDATGHGLAAVLVAAPLAGALLPGVATPLWARGLGGGLLGIGLLLVTWRYTVDVSAFLPGVLWVLLSLGWLELSRRPQVGAARGGLELIGVATFGAFLVRHGLVDLQNEAMLGPVSLRGAVELYAAAVAAWWVMGTRERGAGPVAWALEAVLGLVALFLALEVPGVWLALALAVWAVSLVELARRLGGLQRLLGWAVVVHVAALVRVAVLSSRLVSPEEGWQGAAWVLSAVALVVGFGGFLRARDARGLEVPAAWGLGPVVALASAVSRRAAPSWLYPWFVALAIYLAWVFSHGVLTLLWMAECFGVFVAAVWLRDEVLRKASMAAIVVVLGRLLVYDLGASNVLIKAMVFVGSGGLLIGINAIYHRFRDRFTSAEGPT